MPPVTRAAAKALGPESIPLSIDLDDSDYGNDIDDDTLTDLVVQAESQPLQTLVIEPIEENNPSRVVAKVPAKLNAAAQSPTSYGDPEATAAAHTSSRSFRQNSVAVEYDSLNRLSFSPRKLSDSDALALDASITDSRSPLERFRTSPKKPLSVTDLVSPSWCELQYLYSLTKYGRVQKTPAMKQGSKVHAKLEAEVHTAVPVEVITVEDVFGLRMWNVIQGLRTLRSTGMTRELEVWGLVEGQVVNGVIDELCYHCPDKELEAALRSAGTTKKRGRPPKDRTEPTADQGRLDAFVSSSSLNAYGVDGLQARTIYITDVKTRASNRIPTDPVSLRSPYLQMMLYRKLLLQMSTTSLDPYQILPRYKVNVQETFSDTFIAQIVGLDYNFHSSAQPIESDVTPFSSVQDSVDELLQHNRPDKLWNLMMSEFAKTITPLRTDRNSTVATTATTAEPAIVSRYQGGVSPILQAEFRSAATGEVLGNKIFLADDRKLEAYLKDELAWWSGDRPVRGVEIEEAFKCRICTFAETCKWRIEKIEQDVQKSRLRREGRRTSEV